MKHMLILALFLSFLSFSCNKNAENEDIDTLKSGHPRILLAEGEEQQIHDLMNSDYTWKRVHFAILDESNMILLKPELTRQMIGRRLLSTSRELLRRSFFLSYSYRMTGDKRYLLKAEKELLAVSGFNDWNPSHFLDVAEMTMGVAIGYDWLYNSLSYESRVEIRSAILDKGINPSKDGKYNSWLKSSNNWNQVCNAGMVFGALAIQENYPQLTKEIIDRALNSLPLPMDAYKPDGVYPEGYSYWDYGTTFNVLFLSAIEKYLGNDGGLSEISGFLKTAEFLKHMLTPTGRSFNWGDCGTGTNLSPAMFWLAEKTAKPSVLWSEKRFLEQSDFSKFKNIRYLPAVLIWAKNIPLGNISEPAEKFWMGQGLNPVSMMRTGWDGQAIYLGFKAGSPSVNHGHMDIGSFIVEADGLRWAMDLGMQNYESLESLGMSIFGKGQDAQRWTVFRMNTYSHSVLIVDNEQQRVNGYARIDNFSDDENFMFAISDISSVYKGQLKSVSRGVGIKDKNYVIIRDELETLEKTTKVRWQMLTGATVNITGNNTATLSQEGKQMTIRVDEPGNITLTTWSTQPVNNYDAPNPGTILIGFETEIPAGMLYTIQVKLIPGSSVTSAEFNKALSEW